MGRLTPSTSWAWPGLAWLNASEGASTASVASRAEAASRAGRRALERWGVLGMASGVRCALAAYTQGAAASQGARQALDSGREPGYTRQLRGGPRRSGSGRAGRRPIIPASPR